jgi:hypothetical protein
MFVPHGSRLEMTASFLDRNFGKIAIGLYIAAGREPEHYAVAKKGFLPDEPDARHSLGVTDPADARAWRQNTPSLPNVPNDHALLLGPSLVADALYTEFTAPIPAIANSSRTLRVDRSMRDHYGIVHMLPGRIHGEEGMVAEVTMPLAPYLGAGVVELAVAPIPAAG